jgi:hypothetical protein
LTGNMKEEGMFIVTAKSNRWSHSYGLFKTEDEAEKSIICGHLQNPRFKWTVEKLIEPNWIYRRPADTYENYRATY